MNTQAMPPIATATVKKSAMFCMMSPSTLGLIANGFGGIERGCEPLFFAVVACPLPEARTTDAGGAVSADDVAVGIFARHVIDEDVLGDDDVAFHAQHLGDVGDAAGAVAQARRLHHNVDRTAQHFANGA